MNGTYFKQFHMLNFLLFDEIPHCEIVKICELKEKEKIILIFFIACDCVI